MPVGGYTQAEDGWKSDSGGLETVGEKLYMLEIDACSFLLPKSIC